MKVNKFAIKNYKSLKNVNIDDFDLTTILFGENNAGKSNILSALKLIFSRKRKLSDERILTEEENFYGGVIPESRNLYFDNDISQIIDFSVELEVNKEDLDIDDLIGSLFGKQIFNFTFTGKIRFDNINEGSYSEFKVEEVKIDGTSLYVNAKEIVFFPSIGNSKNNQSLLEKAFARLMDKFNDCVYIVVSDRDMHDSEILHDEEIKLTPKTFKRFLYSLYLSQAKFELFEEINSVFNSPPFSFGAVSFSKDGQNLEIMVKENNFRLPIKSLGSGTLQCLYIITAIIYNKNKIVCIEELEQNLSPNKQDAIIAKIKSMIGSGEGKFIGQIIIASHSPVFANPELGAIYMLKKDHGATIVVRKEQKEKNSPEIIAHFGPSLGRGTYTNRKKGWDLI